MTSATYSPTGVPVNLFYPIRNPRVPLREVAPRLRKKFKKVWVEALRSGKYEQAKSALHVTFSNGREVNQFCCLGVACDVSPNFQWTGESNNTAALGASILRDNLQWHTQWAKEFWPVHTVDRNAYFQGNSAEVVRIPELGTSLVCLNDAGFTFNQIADVIDYFL